VYAEENVKSLLCAIAFAMAWTTYLIASLTVIAFERSRHYVAGDLFSVRISAQAADGSAL
jgi:hypothetical protein